MKRTITLLLLFTTILFLAETRSTRAQGKAPATPSAQITQVIMNMAGQWSGEVTMKQGEKETKFKLTIEEKKSLNGWGMHGTWKADIPDLGKYAVDGIWGYDAGGDMIHWFTVTNMAETHDHKGKMEGNKLTLTYDGMMGGKSYVEVVVFEMVEKNKMRLESTVSIDSHLDSRMEGFLRK